MTNFRKIILTVTLAAGAIFGWRFLFERPIDYCHRQCGGESTIKSMRVTSTRWGDRVTCTCGALAVETSK